MRDKTTHSWITHRDTDLRTRLRDDHADLVLQGEIRVECRRRQTLRAKDAQHLGVYSCAVERFEVEGDRRALLKAVE
ncbi:MAG: hypothetical protein QOI08_1389 [Actinomycetota bacterium]|nr:hypothetical protein [Actinomycetota bacterium]